MLPETREEFIDFYGREDEWNDATSVQSDNGGAGGSKSIDTSSSSTCNGGGVNGSKNIDTSSSSTQPQHPVDTVSSGDVAMTTRTTIGYNQPSFLT